MTDKTCRKPVGTTNDILIKIDNLYFPIYFMVLDIGAVLKIPHILERPELRKAVQTKVRGEKAKKK